MLLVVAEIHEFPESIVEAKESLSEFLALAGGPGGLRGAVLEHDHGLREMFSESCVRTQKDKRGVRDAVFGHELGIAEKTFSRTISEGLVS